MSNKYDVFTSMKSATINNVKHSQKSMLANSLIT
jgi:hypothetical protein